MARRYLRALYHMINTMSTVGYGDLQPATSLETIWSVRVRVRVRARVRVRVRVRATETCSRRPR